MIAMPDPAIVPGAAVEIGRAVGRPHDLRRAHSRRRALRGRLPPRAADGARADAVARIRRLQVGPELEFFYFRLGRGREAARARRRRVLRGDDRSTRRSTCASRPCSRWRRWGSRSSTCTTRSGRASTRSTCATPTALDMADHCITYRSVVKEVAKRHGVYATFMPKPLFGVNGSGMHTHQSLFIGGRTPSTTPTTAGTCRTWPRASSPASCGTPARSRCCSRSGSNSYKRLVPGYEAPVYIAWSRRNRSALIRVPLYHPGKERRHGPRSAAPTRPATPTWRSPALLHAGLEGIEQGYELPDPMETNLYS